MMYGFISYQGEYHLYEMPTEYWTLDMKKRFGKKKIPAAQRDDPRFQPEVLTLTDDNIDEWLDPMSDYMMDVDSMRDEYLDSGGDLIEAADLLPGVWVNIDEKELYIIESVAGETDLEKYLPVGWSVMSLPGVAELIDLLPESMIYWQDEDKLDFKGTGKRLDYDDDEYDDDIDDELPPVEDFSFNDDDDYSDLDDEMEMDFVFDYDDGDDDDY